MSGKKKKKSDKKPKQKNTAAIEERFKKAMATQPPDEQPFKMDNENKIDRFRYLYRTERRSLKAQHRQSARHNRPKKAAKTFI
ncbi:hypothetical protein HQ545_06700 [Candidatus Woesearchaeota archaeon]|nr:hypothetical protein [Candidatus Woesearchaeota archaeon]